MFGDAGNLMFPRLTVLDCRSQTTPALLEVSTNILQHIAIATTETNNWAVLNWFKRPTHCDRYWSMPCFTPPCAPATHLYVYLNAAPTMYVTE